MKTSKIITIIIVLAAIGFFAFMLLSKKSEPAYTLPAMEQTSSIKGCYVATLSKDVYTLSVTSEDGENVEGTLSFKNFEKDSSKGTFKGIYKDGILFGDYSFDSEGSHSVMQVIFKKTTAGFIRGYGDVDSTGERFADVSSITYDGAAVFKASADCAVPSALDTGNWKTFSDSVKKISFKYPENIGATYINTVDWPPKVEIQSTPLKCVPAGKETDRTGQTSSKNINGRNYCVTKVSEGAAGSTYIQYAYATQLQSKTFFFTFTLRTVQCANYSDPQKTACESERSKFSIDPIIDTIVSTLVQA